MLNECDKILRKLPNYEEYMSLNMMNQPNYWKRYIYSPQWHDPGISRNR